MAKRPKRKTKSRARTKAPPPGPKDLVKGLYCIARSDEPLCRNDLGELVFRRDQIYEVYTVFSSKDDATEFLDSAPIPAGDEASGTPEVVPLSKFFSASHDIVDGKLITEVEWKDKAVSFKEAVRAAKDFLKDAVVSAITAEKEQKKIDDFTRKDLLQALDKIKKDLTAHNKTAVKALDERRATIRAAEQALSKFKAKFGVK